MRLTKKITMSISGALTALAVVLALLGRRLPCTLAAAAMAVSTLGDALLAGFPGCFADIKNRLVKGGLVFFAAHILYILAFIAASGRDVPVLLPRFALPFAVFLILTAAHGALFYFRAHSPMPRPMFAAAFLYLLAVGVHASTAAAVFDLTGRHPLLIAGTLLFYLSDAILLAREYGAVRGKHISALVWITYAPAQLCLLIGFYLF